MEGTPTKARGWTDTEKVGLFLQIINKAGKIPWDELELPSGRTLKACQVMVDKEKQKIKKAEVLNDSENHGADKADIDGGKPTVAAKKAAPRKRKTADDENVEVAKPKKSRKTPGQKVIMAQADNEASDDAVKAESDGGADGV